MAIFKKHKLSCAITATLSLTLVLGLSGCGDDDLNPENIDTPSTYEFNSLTQPGQSSVDYSQATSQLILIKELEALINSEELANLAENGKSAVISRLNEYYTANPVINTLNIQSIESDLPLEQTQLSDLNISSLKSSLAGTHGPLFYRDSTDTNNGNFIGWALNSISNEDELPDAKVQFWFDGIASALVNDDTNLSDKSEIIRDFLFGAIAYYQATGVLLNTGLNASNSSIEKYTDLQHNWDLAFGYFGAHPHYGNYSASENAITLDSDLNNNGEISLLNEYNFEYATLSAKSDSQSSLSISNYSQEIFTAFSKGRALIDLYNNTQTNDDPEFFRRLLAQANIISQNWEKALVVQLINNIKLTVIFGELFTQNDLYRSVYYRYWARSKNIAITLQFNPNSIISYLELVDIHRVMKYSTPTTDLTQYFPELNDLRTKLADIYNIDLEGLN